MFDQFLIKHFKNAIITLGVAIAHGGFGGLYTKPKSVEQKGYELIVDFMRRVVFVGLVNIHAFNQKMPGDEFNDLPK